ncbi:TPA: amidohydrolase [Salmonella enterica]|nr:amidohydrolase [Salmonella enterica]
MKNLSTTIFKARSIITMDPARPLATHVAVRDGKIVGVGTEKDIKDWGEARLDERYSDCFLMPGLVEAHSHMMEGGMWMYVYVGYYDRTGPDGHLWEGLKSLDAVCERLRESLQALPEGKILLGWGFDPIYFPEGGRMTVRELDSVSNTRPVVVLHASMHLMNVNSVMLKKAGIDRDSEVEGVIRFENGEPTGELREVAAMFPVMRLIGNPFFKMLGMSENAIRLFGKVAQRAGVTTATDMVNELDAEAISTLNRITAEQDYPLRIVASAASMAFPEGADACLAGLKDALPLNHEKLRFGTVKLVIDGSIQGFSARVRDPGYYNGAPNGIWTIPPTVLDDMVMRFHAAGVQMHLHTNGDEATEVALNALEKALSQHPRPDHRHTLQHCQMADEIQFSRMADLGLCVNLFANHIWYWGDAHYEQTMGPERANRMDACRTALRTGLPLAIHSDAPITPIAPFFTAWCAVNRLTAGGRILGENERISVEQALHAITMGAAYTLHLDNEIGSIKNGKWADFCVLLNNPLEMDPASLKDVKILGTVIGGVPLELGE